MKLLGTQVALDLGREGRHAPAAYPWRDGRVVTFNGCRVELTKAAQVRMVGNSVPPQVVEALVRANVPEYARRAA